MPLPITKVPDSALNIQIPRSTCVCKMATNPSATRKQFFAVPEKQRFLRYDTFEARLRCLQNGEISTVADSTEPDYLPCKNLHANLNRNFFLI